MEELGKIVVESSVVSNSVVNLKFELVAKIDDENTWLAVKISEFCVDIKGEVVAAPELVGK